MKEKNVETKQNFSNAVTVLFPLFDLILSSKQLRMSLLGSSWGSDGQVGSSVGTKDGSVWGHIVFCNIKPASLEDCFMEKGKGDEETISSSSGMSRNACISSKERKEKDGVWRGGHV